MKYKKGRMPPSPYASSNRPLDPGGSGAFVGSGFSGVTPGFSGGSGFAPGGSGSTPGAGFDPRRPPDNGRMIRGPVRRRRRGGWIAASAAAILIVAAVAVLASTTTDGNGGSSTRQPPPVTAPYATVPDTTPDTPSTGSTAPDTTEPAVSVRETAAKLIPYFESRYFLNSLSDEYLACVCELYAGAMNFEPTVKLASEIDKDELDVCTTAMTADCPELMQLDFSIYGYSYNYSSTTDRVVDVTFQYVMTESEYGDRRAACEEAVAEIVSLASGLDELGREKVAFDYIIGPTWYDKDTAMSGNAYGALIERRAKCIGFAHAMKWALDALGIQAITVTADIPGQTEGHAWNDVYLDGGWHRVDLTPSAIYETDTDIGFDRPIYYALNISDHIDDTDYIIDDSLIRAAPLPVCTSMDLSPYALSGQLVRSGEDWTEYLESALADALLTGDGRIILQFEDGSAYQDMINGLSDRVSAWTKERKMGYSYQVIHSDQFDLMAMAITFMS